jgi:hypothetical protein
VITNLPAILRGRAIKENVDMDELISKRAVIEAIEKARANVGHNLERSIGESIIEILDDVGRDINGLPSALGTNLASLGTDCISRQALLDKFEPWLKVKDYNDGELNMLKAILYEIRFMRSAQPEIIRCKDCRHWIPYDWMFSEIWKSKNIADYPEDEIGCDCSEMAMKANDFCSRGERRESGQAH